MKRLLFAALALLGLTVKAQAAPLYGYVQITTTTALTPPIQRGSIKIASGTVQDLTVTYGLRTSTMSVSVSTITTLTATTFNATTGGITNFTATTSTSTTINATTGIIPTLAGSTAVTGPVTLGAAGNAVTVSSNAILSGATFYNGATTVMTGLSVANSTTTAVAVMSSFTLTGLPSGYQLRSDQVANLFNYRAPNLSWVNATQVQLAANNSAGSVSVLFPDGDFRTCSSPSCTILIDSQTATLSGTFRGGMAPGETVAANTWYAVWACKVTSDNTNFTVIASTNLPTSANLARLTADCGTNGFRYIGGIANGDNSGATTSIPKFVMAGNRTVFSNACTGNASTLKGIRLATTAGATSLTWTYGSGTAIASAQVPANYSMGLISMAEGASTIVNVTDSAATINVLLLRVGTSGSQVYQLADHPLSLGASNNPSGSTTQDILLSGFVDAALGVGANPLF